MGELSGHWLQRMNVFLKWLRVDGVWAISCALILVLGDLLAVRWMGLGDKFPRPFLAHLSQGLLILGLFRFAFSRRAFFVWMNVFLTFSLLQWLSLAFYGSYLSPMMLFLAFRETGEVLETGLAVLPSLWKPSVIWLGAMSLNLALYRRAQKKQLESSNTPSVEPSYGRLQKVIKGLIIFTLIYPMPRTFITGHTFGKQAKVQEMSFVNFYGALSYLVGRILPAKARGGVGAATKVLVPSKTEMNPQRHVILILGESLGFKHMQIFDYSEPTTPMLNEMKRQGTLLARKGISGGVSTDVSIPMLIHGTSGLEAASTIASQERCIFKLAKQNGFQTSFLSVQTQENLQHISNYFCSTYLDRFKVGDNARTVNGESNILDDELLDEVQSIDWKNPQFVIFHQRGSHSPYDMRYPKEAARWSISTNDSWEIQQNKHYDNSVFFTDKVTAELVKRIREQTQLPVEIIFTSDHGEALGEDQNWGHVILYPLVAEVPMVYFPQNESFKAVFNQQPEWMDHRALNAFLVHLLGYRLEPMSPQASYFVMGADLDGLGGHMLVRPSGGRLEQIKE